MPLHYYYAIYHASLAVLVLHGLQSKSHTRTIALLEKCGYNSTFIKKAKQLREDAQYSAKPELTLLDAQTFLYQVRDHLAMIERTIDRQ